MAKRQDRAHELDYLGGKVYQAKELIARLRDSNRALKSRLEELERRLQSVEAEGATPSEPARPMEESPAGSVDPTTQELTAEVERLRRERRIIRERVSGLLERIESLAV